MSEKDAPPMSDHANAPGGHALSAAAYHEACKHRFEGYAPSPGFLDWDAQPSPFRRYRGAPETALPLVGAPKPGGWIPEPRDLGAFLELAFGLTAWKSLGADRWSMRANPSSGNLHPTEVYLLLWRSGAPNLTPGLYHYAPHGHHLEQRASLPRAVAEDIAATCPGTFGALGLSSVIWREEWKYGSRAYRYCQHDVGHALASARYAAAALNWGLALDPTPSDDTLAACLGLDRAEDHAGTEPEHPDLLALLGPDPGPPGALPWSRIAASLTEWTGVADGPVAPKVRWPEVAGVLPSTRKPALPPPPPPTPTDSPALVADQPLPALIRQRRSAQRMDGKTGMAWTDFERCLSRTLPAANRPPFDAWPWDPALNLLLFIHAVDGLEPGLYLLDRCPARSADFRAACAAPDLTWTPVSGTALPLLALRAPQDLRRETSKLSCHQGIAGRGAFSLGMIGALGRVLEAEGDWAYRRLHWEAGLIGQTLYLEAEASGLRGTGIGCFMDDAVHDLLGLPKGPGAPWATLYHFTIGKALDDPRLTTEPAYAHLTDRRDGMEYPG
jgi:SagB-type dehydrogenase family enzyme